MFKRIKKFLCKIGWHSFGYEHLFNDGCNNHARCKWCKMEGLVDSQGNLFDPGNYKMLKDVKAFRVKKTVEHQDIGGKIFVVDEQISNTLTNNDVFFKAMEGNWACYNFVERRDDFNCNFNHRLYYGKVDGLGYIVAEDELEELDR